MMLNKKTALIVEDEEVSAKLIDGILSKLGFETIVCTNGKTAFEMLMHDQEIIDIVITDIVMPDMDGKELLHLIRSNEATVDIPVIIVSGLVEEEELASLTNKYNPEITRSLKKPINLEQLKSCLQEFELL